MNLIVSYKILLYDKILHSIVVSVVNYWSSKIKLFDLKNTERKKICFLYNTLFFVIYYEQNTKVYYIKNTYIVILTL